MNPRPFLATSVLIACTSIASAQAPGETQLAVERPSAPASYYVDAGSMVGVEAPIDHPVVGLFLEGGLHIAGPLWAHGIVAGGSPLGGINIDHPEKEPSGTYAAGRVGAQIRLCDSDGRSCFVTGIDLGARHYDEARSATTLNGIQASGQIGLDIAVGRRMWLRPAFQGLIDLGRDHAGGLDGGFLSMAIGVQY